MTRIYVCRKCKKKYSPEAYSQSRFCLNCGTYLTARIVASSRPHIRIKAPKTEVENKVSENQWLPRGYEERKGQVKLLEAIVKIKKTYPRIHLIFVGDGPVEEKLKKMVKESDLSGNVTFFPFTSAPVYIYEVIDILVLASLYKEGLPNALLEAMSMQLPVVASHLAGVPEVVKDGETGYMVDPGNSSQLAEAVVKLWSDPETYSDMARNARQFMASTFDKKRQFRAFLNYFERILSRGSLPQW